MILAAERPVHLRRRWHLEGPRRRRAARARRAHRHLRRHHLDGARRVPRRPSALSRHAGHARQRHRGHRRCRSAICSSRSAARFDDRVTGKVSTFAPDAKVIHVDIDPAEQGKVRRPDVPIVGDCRLVIEEIVAAISAPCSPAATVAGRHVGAGRAASAAGASMFPLAYEPSRAGRGVEAPVLPRGAARFGAARGHHPRVRRRPAPDVGVAVLASSTHPYTWVNSGGLGTMGFAVPAAIGAKVGRPDRMVWAVDGDGCFQMTAQELVTASIERIPIKVAILNNAYLGMVRQWQEMFYDERYSEVYLSPELPDFVKWAEAMGCVGIRVDSPEEVQPAIDKANSIDDRPVVVDFRTDSREKVFPMVPPGQSNDDIILPVVPGQGVPAMSDMHRSSHPFGPRREQGRRARPGRRGVRPPGFQHLLAGGGADRGTSVSAASRSCVDVDSAPLEQIVKQLFKLIDVVEDQRARPAARRSSASCCWRPCGPRPTQRGQIVELVQIFEGRSSPSASMP